MGSQTSTIEWIESNILLNNRYIVPQPIFQRTNTRKLLSRIRFDGVGTFRLLARHPQLSQLSKMELHL